MIIFSYPGIPVMQSFALLMMERLWVWSELFIPARSGESGYYVRMIYS